MGDDSMIIRDYDMIRFEKLRKRRDFMKMQKKFLKFEIRENSIWPRMVTKMSRHKMRTLRHHSFTCLIDTVVTINHSTKI